MSVKFLILFNLQHISLLDDLKNLDREWKFRPFVHRREKYGFTTHWTLYI